MVHRIRPFIEAAIQTAAAWAQTLKTPHPRWRWAGYALNSLAPAYIVYLLVSDRAWLSQVDWPAYSLAVPASLGLFLVSLMVQFVVWARMISFHRSVGWQDVEIFSRTALMRNLPGSIWPWVGRAVMYSSTTEIPRKVVVYGSLLEWALVLLVGFAFSCATSDQFEPALRLTASGLAIGVALILAIAWQPARYSLIRRVGEGLLWLLLYGAAWSSGLLIFGLFVQATGVGQREWLPLLHAWCVASTFGWLTILTPLSLTMREFTLVWLLRPYMTVSSVVVVALLVRLVYVLADVLWGYVGLSISQSLRRRREYLLSDSTS